MVNSLIMGGSERQMVEVACRQKTKGYDITVGCLLGEGPLNEILKQANIPVIEFNPQGGLHRPKGISQLFKLTRYLSRGHFDVVQTHDLYSTLMAVPASKVARVPVILSCRRDLSHWWWYTPRRRKILRHIQNRSTYVIANSDAVRDYLVTKDGFDPKLIRVIQNGVEYERFANTPRERQRLFPKVPLDIKLVAVVANMHLENKGHADLIRAATDIIQKFPNTKFVLIGDGVERPKLEDMAVRMGLRDRILFLGARNDIPDLLASSDLFVLPSWAEGLPNSVLEAMASGLPIVATRVGGIPELIENEVSGLLVPPKNDQALSMTIKRLLGDEVFAKKLGMAAQERARKKFSFERLLRELEDLYLGAGPHKVEIDFART
jgi:L-malate glycosyltransferase